MTNLKYGDCLQVRETIYRFLYYSLGMNLIYVEIMNGTSKGSKYSINNYTYKKIECPKP